MAKAKVTRKWVRDNFNCISVGYCDLQNLLHYVSPDYYTCGVYGWNFDVYTFGDYAITTGYRNMVDNCRHEDFSCSEWDDKAREIIKNHSWDDYDRTRKEVNSLLEDFLKKTFNAENIRVC